MGVLDGIRVLDFGRYIAGPLCSSLLGDLGAEVIRIERVGGGEDRLTAPLGDDTDAGAGYHAFNRNKKGLTLDPGSPRGREIVRRLVKTADIVVVNMPIDAITKIGLDYESLTAIKPDIILIHTSAFGTEGPYMERVGFDGIGQAMNGATYISGDERGPRRTTAPYVDVTTAMFNAYGALAALRHRDQTGEGQKVETNLLRSALQLTNATLIEQALVQANRYPGGNRMQGAGPSDIHKTTDGWVLVQVVSEGLFRRWAKLVGAEDLIGDPRFVTDELRGQHNDILSARTEAWISNLTTVEALNALGAAKIPAGPVLSPQQALDDPHINAAKYFYPREYPGLPEPAPIIEPGARFSKTPSLRGRPPTVGEHTDEILAGIGYSKDEIAQLRAEGVV